MRVATGTGAIAGRRRIRLGREVRTEGDEREAAHQKPNLIEFVFNRIAHL